MNLKEMTDKQLIEMVKRNGSLNIVVNELYRRYEAPLQKFIIRRADQVEAEDVVQETFMIVGRYLKTFQGDGKFLKTWIYGIAINKINDYFRERKKDAFMSIEDYFPEVTNLSTKLLNPEQTTAETLVVVRMEEKIESLPKKLRETIWLRINGFSYEEIAELSRIPMGTAKTRVHRARNILREYLL